VERLEGAVGQNGLSFLDRRLETCNLLLPPGGAMPLGVLGVDVLRSGQW